ncbi:unnamed protein product [Malus baccata var. baccata]
MQTSRIARIADFKHCRIGGKEADDKVRAAGGADVKGGAAEALEGELALANEGAGITVHNSLWLHHRDRIMQIVVHCSGADLKVESGVTTDLDRKSLLASDNSNGSIDNIVGSNSVSNANNVQKVKKDGDQVVGSNEGIGDKKSNPSKEIGEMPKEVDNGANTVFVNLIRKEGTRSEECDTSNIYVLMRATSCLYCFVRLDETKIQLEEKENRKGGAGSSIILKARNGRCNLDLKDLITNSSRKKPENSSNFAYTNFPKQKPTIAILFFASAMILASAWMCISFRNRRVSGNNNWDDNWDDEEAPHTPSMPITPSLFGKGLAS